ncbi:MAG TPA: hypothetical protein VK419_08750 [Bryobacteraceae bacterium]|nr:hypothetical protein [Bryobacteraceae bacterium]
MKRQRANIEKKRGKRAELADWLALRQPAEITEAEFEELRDTLSPVSESYLRKLLRESGARLSPLVEGVRQASLDELEASLLRMLGEYGREDAPHRARVRQLVIAAKDHARWAARNPERRAEKEEMRLWMLTWLENPPVFPQWLRLRQAALRGIPQSVS